MSQEKTLPPDAEAPQEFGRRTIVRGAAWSVPVIAMASAAPRAAASGPIDPGPPPPLALNGWVLVTGHSDYSLQIDGSFKGTEEPGLWVEGTTGTETITNASVTLCFSRKVGDWYAGKKSSKLWTTPTYIGTNVIASTGQAVYSYKFTYIGPWVVAPGRSYANDIEFTFHTKKSVGKKPLAIWARRSVTVDGAPIVFDRGPIRWWGA